MAALLQINLEFTPDDSCGWVSVGAYYFHPSKDEVIRQLEKAGCVFSSVTYNLHFRVLEIEYFEEYT